MRLDKAPRADNAPRRRTNALMISMFALTALGHLSIPDSMATPSWVNARGGYLEWPPRFKIPIWNLKVRCSLRLKTIMKSTGNRSRFRDTALFRLPVVTPYNRAKSASRMTRRPRMKRINPAAFALFIPIHTIERRVLFPPAAAHGTQGAGFDTNSR